MQGRNGEGGCVCHQGMVMSALTFWLLPPSQSPLMCPPPSVGQRWEGETGKPHCQVVACSRVSYSQGLLCLNVPIC